ncbi:hypothetical protein L6452_34215 [Arctium lappa]|uniref:Uncharacterized protein n=1 Tax=Arctium lappa TaxID=4217 RepID=A0ACB8YLU0_ARCLA|nr:hypothetical protein L6452_34215 [Arctium lappa]
MVSIRCDVFVFAITFILLHFVVNSLQDTEKMVSVARDKFEERTTVLSRQEKDALKAVPRRVDVMMNVKVIGGRKTMKMVHEEEINGEEMASKKASPSSANPRNGDDKVSKASFSNANPRNGDDKVPKNASSSSNPRNDNKVPKASSLRANPRNGDHKVPKRQKKIYHHDHEHHHVEVKMRSTFMALNADYHVPRSHPPRNN